MSTARPLRTLLLLASTLLSLLLAYIPTAQGAPAIPAAQIDAYIEAQMKAARIPGMAVIGLLDRRVRNLQDQYLRGALRFARRTSGQIMS